MNNHILRKAMATQKTMQSNRLPIKIVNLTHNI